MIGEIFLKDVFTVEHYEHYSLQKEKPRNDLKASLAGNDNHAFQLECREMETEFPAVHSTQNEVQVVARIDEKRTIS